MLDQTRTGGAPARIRRRAHQAKADCEPNTDQDTEEALATDQPSINTRTQFGSVGVKDPGQVVRLAMVIENHRLNDAWRMWPEVEYMFVDQLTHLNFDPKDLFYSEKAPVAGKNMTTVTRYYTPIPNRVKSRG